MDPLAEKHPEWSPYNYVLNNPLILVNPDGRQVRADSYGNYDQKPFIKAEQLRYAKYGRGDLFADPILRAKTNEWGPFAMSSLATIATPIPPV